MVQWHTPESSWTSFRTRQLVPTSDASEVRIQGFAGWKAGMTHVLSRDLNPTSTSAGQEVRVPVTVVEVPKMRILGVRGYKMTPYGKQAAGEAWLNSEQIADAFPEVFNRISNRKITIPMLTLKH